MSVPKKPQKNFVDTRGGDKQPLEPSGMEPKYTHKRVCNVFTSNSFNNIQLKILPNFSGGLVATNLGNN